MEAGLTIAENIHRIRRSKLLSIIDNSSRLLGILANRINKRRGVVRRFWKRPGRTDAWWGKFREKHCGARKDGKKVSECQKRVSSTSATSLGHFSKSNKQICVPLFQ